MKVGIFVDGMTLYHGLEGRKIDFGDFLIWLLEDNILSFAGYFNTIPNLDTKHNFFLHVEKSGFSLFIREALYDFERGKNDISNLNIELSIEVIDKINEYDKVILVSGKKDFLPLCEKLISNGKSVEIIGYEKSIHKNFMKYKVRYIEDFLDKKIYI